MSPKNKQKILVMAGGTGGHIMPGLAVAAEMIKRGYSVEWLGTERGLESSLVPKAGLKLNVFPVNGIRGKGLKSLLFAPLNIVRAVLHAKRIIANVQPSLVIGFGGFVAGPGGLAARLLRIPLVIHEQNAVAGTTNKLLSNVASKVLCAFPVKLQKAIRVGNPVREVFTQVPSPDERAIGENDKKRVLILGGSRGALALNNLLPQAFSILKEQYSLEIRHQAGAGKDEHARANYLNAGVDAQVSDFIDDLVSELSWADLVVCRAGALTVSEISAVGVPALFVPFPYAIDDHQTANAEFLANSGAAILVQEKDASPELIAREISKLFSDGNKLKVMANSARTLATIDSTKRIADICEELI